MLPRLARIVRVDLQYIVHFFRIRTELVQSWYLVETKRCDGLLFLAGSEDFIILVQFFKSRHPNQKVAFC